MKKFGKIAAFAFAILTLFSLTAFRPLGVAANECGGPYPPKPGKVWAKSGPTGGEVTLYWDEVAYADRYAVAYGRESGNYVYGATNIGGSNARSYTVKGLTPGIKYYFSLAAARDCTSSPFSNEVTAWAGGAAPLSGASASQGGVTVRSGGTDMSYQTKPQTASNLSVWSGPGVGQVTMKWWHKEDVDNYHVVYGTAMGQYQYGALNIGKVTQFTVGSLSPGKAYYFALVPVKGDRALYTGQAVRGVAKGYPVSEVVMTNPANLMKPVEVTPVYKKPVSINLEEGSPVVPPEEEDVQGIEDQYTDDEYQQSQDLTVPENIGGLPDIGNEGYVGSDVDD